MKYAQPKPAKPAKYKTPSEFGSHASMEATEEQLAEYGLDAKEQELAKQAGKILLYDENGLYATKLIYLDTGFADGCRHNSFRYYVKKKG